MKKLFQQLADDEETKIDITPMLDVVFIMLIFFIVTATFVKEDGIEVNKPPPSNEPPDPDKKTILVRIDSNDQIWIQSRLVDTRAVRPNIERLHAENIEAPVVILSSKRSSTDTLMTVMDSARQADVFNVALAEQTP